MSGVEISPGNEAAELLGDFGKLLSGFEYNRERILSLTGAESLIDFSNDEFSDLAGSEGDADLVYLVRLFLLRMQVPLKDLLRLVGADCCKLLLELQVVTAVRSGRMLSIEEATKDLTGDSTCFSNVRLWPLTSLIIATDAQTWPYQDGAERFEPVMYLSDDSLALLDAAPKVQGLNILDICCGSGVQGISALQNNAASVTFSDLNPRALRFVRFNLALNSLLSEACDFALGDAYSALESKTFDGILANPPFLPNPDGIASQAIAMYGYGGSFGEDVLRSIVAGCSQRLVTGGWLMMVTYAPNVEQMPERLRQCLGRVKREA